MKRYPQYKLSGVDWIGEIPEQWGIIKLKYIAYYEKGKNAALYTKEYIGQNFGDYPVYSGQTENEGVLGTINTYDYDVEKGLLVTTVGAKAMTLRKLSNKFSLSQNCALIFKKDKRCNLDYYYYYLICHFAFEKGRISLIMQPSLRFEDLDSYIVIFPPEPEQTAIANYLDKKVNQIDQLIEKKKKLIELYKEERAFIINQAVTRGIDLKVKLKPSGIDWLGDIPEHWEVNKLRYVGNCQNGISKGSEYFGSGYPFISYGDVYNNEEIPLEISGLAQSSEEDRFHYSVQEGDVFFTRTSETIEEIGIASICMKTLRYATFSGFLIRFRPSKDIIYKGFSKYYFRCQKHRNYFVKEMNLVTRASLSQDLLKNLPVLIPPFQEQVKVYDYLETETRRIDHTIFKIENEMELLTEYRTALISEVVTGKIKVI